METRPGFRAQKQQSGFKATLLVTGAPVRAPALCRAHGSFLLGSQGGPSAAAWQVAQDPGTFWTAGNASFLASCQILGLP